MTVNSQNIILARRYFQRLEEVLGDKFPEIPAPQAPEDCRLDDFYLAARTLGLRHELPGLGFAFGCGLRVSDYGVVGLAIASTRCLSEAIETQLRFLNMIADTARIAYQFYEEDRWMVLKVRRIDTDQPLDPFTSESEMGAQLRFIRDLLPTARMSQNILSLHHDCPTSSEEYRKLAGCQVNFNQPGTWLQIPLSWADSPLESADELLAPMLALRCELFTSQMEKSGGWAAKVRNYLLTSTSCNKSVEETAAALGVSRSNLRWQLARNDTNYKQILLDVRMKLACQYLEGTPLTLQQISYQLGYRYPANFQLAFKKYFGVPPGQWRQTDHL